LRTHLDITDLLEFLCASDILHGVQNVTHQLILQLRGRPGSQLVGFHPIYGYPFSLEPARVPGAALDDIGRFKDLFGVDGRHPVKSSSAIMNRHPTRPIRRRFEHVKRSLRRSLRGLRPPAPPLALHADVRSLAIAAGDLVIVPGLNVWYPEHNRELGEHVRAQGARLVVVVHDFGPMTAAQYFPASYQAAFRDWITNLFPYADLFVADSEYTRREMNAVPPELRRANCLVNPLAHEYPNQYPNQYQNQYPNQLPNAAAAGMRPAVADLEDYVLHVGRIEPRKNLAGLIKVWARLAGELGPALPCLVLSGRMNDPTGEFAAALDAIGAAADRIRFLKDLSAAELARLYACCRFTVYPSFYEGWGLPVGEAACFGKVTAASNAASIPEVVGDLAVYFDPHDLDAMAAVLRRLVTDRAYLAGLESRLKATFHPRSWADCAKRLLELARDLKIP
jgi:glycosyltransferase involved in cell wall biosynthesis